MKKLILLLLAVTLVSVAYIPPTSNTKIEQAYKSGEWFKFRIHYGMFNASYATLQVEDKKLNGKDVYHLKGKGESTGLMHLFFKVDDRYESYVDRKSGKPYRFIRDIDEGGHTKDIQIDFNHDTGKAVVNNKKKNRVNTMDIKPGTQDMISSFYHLRNIVDHNNLQNGDEFILPMFFDNENYDFKMKFLEREIVKTKFGKIKALKFRPYVQSGRVFEEEESLTVWISDDENKIPLKIEAKLAVGSLTADLDAFKGLSHSFMKIAE
ncbi:Protein of unknown function [Nonlabens sp. Hel1_33_55]|uniref:DUF3108 domain-containing protein n=1 Tax=Nonlabens sp. Hel1_33_55 TaxID=1336802 RepID=UPI000875B70C|nr:DUF3108 domain-containing protein [Nonlabens sp. Hel1_33_55]SCY28543.1 Protein of unknown function [Nonlabens sp. Hel1_33_55]